MIFTKNPFVGCTAHALVHTGGMKTITLTDEAYERLKAWKTGRDSFLKWSSAWFQSEGPSVI